MLLHCVLAAAALGLAVPRRSALVGALEQALVGAVFVALTATFVGVLAAHAAPRAEGAAVGPPPPASA